MVTIVTRASKGEALTHDEVDANFNNLNSGKVENSALTAHTSNTSNPHSVTKTQVGLGNVDNTSDANKPVSTAQQTALNGKEPTITAGSTSQYWRGDKSWQTLNSTAVGLGNVNNTSDVDKPVSTSQQAALDLKADKSGTAFTGTVTSPDVNINSISQSIHSGAIVKAFIYDTSRDSDGGAWRKRCQDKSWFNESLNGAWLGQAATAAAAWALSGAFTGAYFQNTTDGKFYALGASSPNVTEVFRGNRAEFPEQVAIIAESGRVIIYDLTQSGTPMWMVFKQAGGGTIYSANVSSVCMLNGILAVGGNTASGFLAQASFVADLSNFRNANGNLYNVVSIANRHTATGPTAMGTTSGIVNATVNDVAMTVLPDAPIDIATGLPIPTIYVGTLSGLSIIKSDGTVTSLTITGNSVASIALYYPYIGFDTSGVSGRYFAVYDLRTLTTHSIGNIDSFDAQRAYLLTATTVPSLKAPSSGAANPKLVRANGVVASGDTQTLILLKDNPGTPAKAMVAYITNAYNTGWQVGDSRGAWLSDTTAETITGSGELVTNGTFGTDTSGWTPTSATLSVVSGAMRVTATASAAPYSDYTVTTVVGRTYKVSAQLKTPMAGKNVFINAGTGQNGSNLGFVNMGTTAGTYSFDFIATTTTTHVNFNGINTFVSGDFFEVDNVSVQLADPDRSTKNTGLIVNGSITKSAVATGAQLMGYSGFSASNYLEQPYNANLDFGTGDFHVMGWFYGGASYVANDQSIFYRAVDTTANTPTNGINIWGFNGGLKTRIGGVVLDTAASLIAAGTYGHFAVIRASGVLYIYINSVLAGSVANTANLTLANAFARVGAGYYTQGNHALALLRAGATAPSADQIAYIYNTEKMLFQSNAKCAIDGTSAAVTALAYDENEDALHVGTSWGRSKFRDLVRIESAATSTGAITSLSAGQGCHIVGGTSARYYQPAMYLREELRRKEEARKALGQVVTPLWATGDGVTTAFAVPKGFYPKFVYKQGLIMRDGTNNDYTISFDGFVYTVTFAAAPLNGHNICYMGVRNG